jgi:signal transduction histidine kinase
LLSTLADRIWATVGAVRIRTKILGIILFLTLLLGSCVTLQVRSRIVETLRTHLREESIHTGKVLAARASDLILTGDHYALHQLLDDTRRNKSDVRYIFVLDQDGRLVAHTFTGGFPRGLLEANVVASDTSHASAFISTTEGHIWDAAVPILDGTVGHVRVGLSEKRLDNALATVTGQILLTTLAVALFGVGVAVGLTWLLTRPILDLVAAARRVSSGDFSRRVKSRAEDEVGDLTESFNSMTDGLAEAAQARDERDLMRSRMLARVISAQEDERKRIARELHDETSQSLTSLMIGLQALSQRSSDPNAQDRVKELREVTAKTLAGVHDLAIRLRPSVLDDLGLVAAVENHLSKYRRRYNLRVDLATQGLDHDRFPAPVETALYRIVQEGLTNVARHAQAHSVSVFIERRGNSIRAIVEDDGCGFDVRQVPDSTRHLGLHGIRERVNLLGGSFRIESEPGSGTSLCMEVPLTTGGSEDQHPSEDFPRPEAQH